MCYGLPGDASVISLLLLPDMKNISLPTFLVTILNVSPNEKKLPSEQQHEDVIIPLDTNTKGLTIDDHQIDLVTDIIDDNDLSKDTLKLKKIIQDTVNKDVDKGNQNIKRYRKGNVNNIFKKFKK